MKEDSFPVIAFDKAVTLGAFDFDYFPFTHIAEKLKEPFN